MKLALRCILILSLSTIGLSAQSPTHWVGSWATSQQVPEPANALASDDLRDATLRQTVHLSIGGSTLRVHLSNAFGTNELRITSAHIASPVKPGGSAIDPATDHALRFSGREDVVIPPGAEYISDAISFPATALSDITISLHLDAAPAQQTGHPGSRATSFVTAGNLVAAADLPSAKKIDHWYFVSGIDVAGTQQAFAIVALGDSITDGHGATTNGNDRWTDVLAMRLQENKPTRKIGVLNHGIGGNHILTDGLGPNVLARFDRDVLAQTAARYVIVLEGINDLGGLARMKDVTAEQHDELVRRMIGAFEQIVDRGVKVIGATILPDTGSDYYHPDASNEADRQKVNQWIRAAGHFDAIVDLDQVMSNPQDRTRLLPAYDSGDHLHPSPAGYKVMGDAFALSMFSK